MRFHACKRIRCKMVQRVWFYFFGSSETNSKCLFFLHIFVSLVLQLSENLIHAAGAAGSGPRLCFLLPVSRFALITPHTFTCCQEVLLAVPPGPAGADSNHDDEPNKLVFLRLEDRICGLYRTSLHVKDLQLLRFAHCDIDIQFSPLAVRDLSFRGEISRLIDISKQPY